MKTGILSILIIILFGTNTEKLVNAKAFDCTITTSKNIYKIGETPEIKVFITNNSRKDIYFIGCLDASEEKWRSPYCYFKIEKPKNDLTPTLGRCGNMNSLRKKDFRLVRSGKSFNPYESVDGYGFFDSYEIGRKENFRILGIYRITFYYSTKSTKIDDYLGDGNKNKELEELFNMVPHIELESNTLEIEIKE